MDTVDDTTVPVWSTDETWLEEADTTGAGEYGDYSGGSVVVEEIAPSPNPSAGGAYGTRLIESSFVFREWYGKINYIQAP